MVKIDGSFVRDLAVNVDNQLFIRNLMGRLPGEGRCRLSARLLFRPPRFHPPLAHRRAHHASGEELERAQPG
jgi:hypothetical protein